MVVIVGGERNPIDTFTAAVVSPDGVGTKDFGLNPSLVTINELSELAQTRSVLEKMI